MKAAVLPPDDVLNQEKQCSVLGWFLGGSIPSYLRVLHENENK